MGYGLFSAQQNNRVSHCEGEAGSNPVPRAERPDCHVVLRIDRNDSDRTLPPHDDSGAQRASLHGTEWPDQEQ